MPPNETDARVVVIGAGPAGLATAAALHRRGASAVVLDRDERIGGSWLDRYDSLRLHTMRSLSGLPGWPIPRSYGRWVARDDVAAYLRAYADRFRIRPELETTVGSVERTALGWTVRARDRDGSERTFAGRAVVVASGCSEPVVPDWPGRADFSVPVTHSATYREPAPYRGLRVLVVGAGNSGAEIATELATAGVEVTVAVRTPPVIVRRSTLGVPSQVVGLSVGWAPEPVLNLATRALRRISVPDLAAYGLRAPTDGYSQFLSTRTVPVIDHGFVDLVRCGRITVVPAVESLAGDRVRLVGGRTIAADAVIAATGYRPGLESLVGDLGVLDDRGRPTFHGADTRPELPGLHFVGITEVLSGLLREIGRDATAVARALTPRR